MRVLPPMLLADADLTHLTREIFGNISHRGQVAFYGVAAIALLIGAVGAIQRVRRWSRGRSVARLNSTWLAIIRRTFVDIVMQPRIGNRGLASLAHRLLFSGFVVLLIGTALIAVEHVLAAMLGRPPHLPVFHRGWYFVLYELTLDTFGIAMLAGVVLFAWRRWQRVASIDQHWTDWLTLGLLATIGVTGFLVEGLRIVRESTPMPGVSYIGLLCAWGWTQLGITAADQIATAHFALWWFHAALALGLIAAVPYLRLWHAVAGALHLAATETRLGRLQPVTLDELESQGFVGVARIDDFQRRQLRSIDACVACGRCEDACPAFEAGKPLSPKQLVQDLRLQLVAKAPTDRASSIPADQHEDRTTRLAGPVISAETLWSCTTCSACTSVCPLGIDPAEMITDLRRHLVGEGELRGSPATALQKSQRTGNPWGLPPQDRLKWADGLDVPTVESNPSFEILYWVGCAAAYDRRTQKVARAVVQLLQKAEVNFAVLGNAERCTGECQRRMGDEFLFQELAESNLETFRLHHVRRIVTHCPHCLNSLRQDYPQFGGNFEVLHHTELLNELVDAGKLTALPRSNASQSNSITYHDPCYLGRVQGQTAAPRALLRGAHPLVELPRHGVNTACCGAGGGHMWMDDRPEARVGQSRIDEIVSTHTQTVAVGCPFCLVMLSDGLAARDKPVQVADVAELMLAALTSDAATGDIMPSDA